MDDKGTQPLGVKIPLDKNALGINSPDQLFPKDTGMVPNGTVKKEFIGNQTVSAPPVVVLGMEQSFINPENKPAPDSKNPTVTISPTVPINGNIEPIPDREPRPIELNYKYSGDCPDCKTEVLTLMAETPVGKGTMLHAIAYCPKCSKQIKMTKVEKII